MSFEYRFKTPSLRLRIWLVVLTSEESIFKYSIYCLNTRICLNQKCSGFFLSHIKGHFHACLHFPKGLRNLITFNKQQNLSKVLTLCFIYFCLNLETKSCRLFTGGAKYKRMRTDRLHKQLGNRLQLTAANHLQSNNSHQLQSFFTYRKV